MPDNQIAVNLGSYGRFRENALSHLQSLGIRYVEIPVPAPDKVEEVSQELARFGLSASTMMAPCDLTGEVDAFAPYARTARGLGVPILFISAKAGDLPRAQAYERLRELAALAGE